MKHQNIMMAVCFSLLAFSAKADEEACVENIHVIGHDLRIAYVTGDLKTPINPRTIGFHPLSLSETYCDIPPSKFRLAVILLPNLSDKKGYIIDTSDAIFVTAEEFNLDAGDYLGFNLSSDANGNLKVLYSRPAKSLFNQAATLKTVPAAH